MRWPHQRSWSDSRWMIRNRGGIERYRSLRFWYRSILLLRFRIRIHSYTTLAFCRTPLFVGLSCFIIIIVLLLFPVLRNRYPVDLTQLESEVGQGLPRHVCPRSVITGDSQPIERRSTTVPLHLSGLFALRLPTLHFYPKAIDSHLIVPLCHRTVCNGSSRNRIL